MLTAKIAVIDNVGTEERRDGSPRAAINRPSTLRLQDGAPRDVEIEDLSSHGFSFSFLQSMPVTVGDRLSVGLDGAGRVAARVVRRDGNRAACMFDPELTARQLTEAFASRGVIASPFALDTSVPGAVSAVAEPEVGKWPGAVRLGTLLVGTAVSWALVVAIARLTVGT